jgi:hypothetical protein
MVHENNEVVSQTNKKRVRGKGLNRVLPCQRADALAALVMTMLPGGYGGSSVLKTGAVVLVKMPAYEIVKEPWW